MIGSILTTAPEVKPYTHTTDEVRRGFKRKYEFQPVRQIAKPLLIKIRTRLGHEQWKAKESLALKLKIEFRTNATKGKEVTEWARRPPFSH